MFILRGENAIILIMANKKQTKRLTKADIVHVHHVIWGVLCAGLILVLMLMWHQIQTLQQTKESLEKQVAVLNAPAPSCSARDTWQPGTDKTFYTLTEDGNRAYTVHLPDNFKPTNYYPLIVHFPGKGANASNGAQQAGLNVLPAVIAYPHPTVGIDGYNAWQGAPYSSNADDVSFTGELLDKIQSQLCIDRKRIYASGMSNGGGMVSLLSCELSNRFAAFGIVAGAMYYPAGACDPTIPTPLINVHGDSDPNVPYGGSITRKLPDIGQWSAERAKDNDCKGQPSVKFIDAVTTVTTWTNCRGNATVENVKLRGGGHIWMPEATQLLWQFMSKHTL